MYVAVYEILEVERAALDECEGLGYGYNNCVVNLDKFGECSTYIADSSVVDDSLSPMDWYKEYVLQGALYHGFPREYVAWIRQQAATNDSDGKRAAREWKLIREILAQ